MKFVKMHGLGNDFIVVEDFSGKIQLSDLQIQKLCHRNFGVGADGLVLILPSQKGDIRMRIFNSDGTEAEMCGNAIRCVARHTYERGLVDKEEVLVETHKGLNLTKVFLVEDQVDSVEVNMGEPVLDSQLVPAQGKDRLILMEDLVLNQLGLTFKITALSMGNPHCVIFVEDGEKMPFNEIGYQIEHHPLFPQKTNVEFVEIISDKEIKMRVWERGVGETLACGTGACASVVASVLNNLTERRVTVYLPGGQLEIYWDEEQKTVFMRGPAERVFNGEVL
ncbi:diaminopimelate epimerase [Candidatus Contubernalis alkaliaceticus]|uniref:diaminopimelate epimerase n=1 Tax=Candidatus Contubernalis alkaliaceticus TaxID=338645 RepID=UPI001F4C4E41|nr:diaminopimelate epimerase [Candidatus Contubernalis alkalaceticus]UNC92940.1 diaminopimelate epimerase [Candidatus Contubernalis alkalaceticus]